MGVQLIERPATGTESWLVNVVRTHAERSGVSTTRRPDAISQMAAIATGFEPVLQPERVACALRASNRPLRLAHSGASSVARLRFN